MRLILCVHKFFCTHTLILLHSLVKSLEKLYLEAETANLDKDEERAFALFFRYLNSLTIMQTKPEYKKDKAYYDLMLPQRYKEKAVHECEILKESLKKRYAEAASSKQWGTENPTVYNKDKTKGTIIANIPKTNGFVKDPSASPLDIRDEKKEEDPSITHSMDARNFKSILEQKSTRTLVIDCRVKSDFSHGRINSPNCICVSEVAHKG